MEAARAQQKDTLLLGRMRAPHSSGWRLPAGASERRQCNLLLAGQQAHWARVKATRTQRQAEQYDDETLCDMANRRTSSTHLALVSLLLAFDLVWCWRRAQSAKFAIKLLRAQNTLAGPLGAGGRQQVEWKVAL